MLVILGLRPLTGVGYVLGALLGGLTLAALIFVNNWQHHPWSRRLPFQARLPRFVPRLAALPLPSSTSAPAALPATVTPSERPVTSTPGPVAHAHQHAGAFPHPHRNDHPGPYTRVGLHSFQ